MHIRIHKARILSALLFGSIIGACLYPILTTVKLLNSRPVVESPDINRLHSSLGGPVAPLTGPGELVDLWNAKQLVDRDPVNALQACMDGESTNPAMWETVLRRLAPADLESAMNLVVRGRCFSSLSAREEATRLLLSLFPLDSLIQYADSIVAIKGPGDKSLLAEFVKDWVDSDPENCLKFALQISKPWKRQQALFAAVSSRSDLRAPQWVGVVQELRPDISNPEAVQEAVENFLTNSEIGFTDRLEWLNGVMNESHLWSNLAEKLLRESVSVREAYALAEKQGIGDDPQLARKLCSWAAEDDQELYMDLILSSQSVEQKKLGLRSGLPAFAERAPEAAIAFLKEMPDLIDSWTFSVVAKRVTSLDDLKKMEPMLDQAMSTDLFLGSPIPPLQYMHQLVKMDPGRVVQAWHKYQNYFPEDQRLRYIQDFGRDMRLHHDEETTDSWIRSLTPNEATAARRGVEECCGN